MNGAESKASAAAQVLVPQPLAAEPLLSPQLGANQVSNHYKHSSALPCTGLRDNAERRGRRRRDCLVALEIAHQAAITVRLSLVTCESSKDERVDSPLWLFIPIQFETASRA